MIDHHHQKSTSGTEYASCSKNVTLPSTVGEVNDFEEYLSIIKLTCIQLLKTLDSKQETLKHLSDLASVVKQSVISFSCDRLPQISLEEGCYHCLLVPSVVYPLRVMIRQRMATDAGTYTGAANVIHECIQCSLHCKAQRCSAGLGHRAFLDVKSYEEMATWMLTAMTDGESSGVSVHSELTHNDKVVMIGCVHIMLKDVWHDILRVPPSKHTDDGDRFSLIGQHVYLLLQILKTNTHNHADINEMVVRCLCLLLQFGPDNEVDDGLTNAQLAAVLPGLSTSLAQMISVSSDRHTNGIVLAVQLLTKLLHRVFSDHVFNNASDQDASKPPFSADLTKAWFAKAQPNVSQVLDVVCRRQLTHSSVDVRMAIGGLCRVLLFDCWNSLASARRLMLDSLTALAADPFQQVKSIGEDALKSLCYEGDRARRNQANQLLQQSLYTLAGRVPQLVRHSSQPSALFAQLVVLIKHVRCHNPTLMTRLLDSLAESIEFDLTRAPIVSDLDIGSLDDIDLQLQSCPQVHWQDDQAFKRVCAQMVESSNLQCLLDVMLDRVLDTRNNATMCCTYVYMLNAVLECVHKGSGEQANLSDFIARITECYCYILADSHLHTDVRDDTISDVDNHCTHQVLLAATAVAGLRHVIVLDGATTQSLQQCLYVMLSCTTSTHTLLQHNAIVALAFVAFNKQQSISTAISNLIFENANYLLHALNIRLRHLGLVENKRAPLVLIACMQLCVDDKLFELVVPIVRELLMSVDHWHSQHSILFMKVLVAFVRAVQVWFADKDVPAPTTIAVSDDDDDDDDAVPPLQQPGISELNAHVTQESDSTVSPVSDDDDQVVVPEHVLLCEQIALRTKHLLSTKLLPLQLVTADLLSEVLKVLEGHERQLLPMVHQNWHPVMCRFSPPTDLVEAAKALQVIVVMCECDGRFVTRRIQEELWPVMLGYLDTLYSSSTGASKVYTHSPKYKLQLAILQAAPTIIENCQLEGTTLKSFESVLQYYMVGHLRRILPQYASGQVVRGFGRGGKQLGCPTANLDEATVAALPDDVDCGVYYGWANVNDASEVQPMVMSIGWNPTFKNTKKTMEVHLLKYDGDDFYGAKMKVIVVGYIRQMAAFNSLEELTQAIDEDKCSALDKLAKPEALQFKLSPFWQIGSEKNFVNTTAASQPVVIKPDQTV